MDEALIEFYQDFKSLTEKDRNQFPVLVNKLLAANYLTLLKESAREDYYQVVSHLKLFQNYFRFMDYELDYFPEDKVIALMTENGGKLKLKLNESIILLILRLLYDEKSREQSLTDRIFVTLETVHAKFLSSGLKDRRIGKTELRKIFSLFKRYNLLDITDSDFGHDDSRIELYPTLLYAVNAERISELAEKLKSYEPEGGTDEETDEN